MRRPQAPARLRVAALGAAVAAVIALSACGGSEKPSKQDYYGSVNTFCGDVAKAAQQVSQATLAVRKDKNADADTVVKAVTSSLDRFASSTESALEKLDAAGVPSDFDEYQRKTEAGFREYISTLRSTAKSARTDGVSALAELESRLNAVKLPDPPADITTNAKACSSISSAAP